jgi:aminoglycoside 6'-N-acetyltransferase I
VDDDGSVVGWVGDTAEYDGHAWELNSLVVHPDLQGKGIGTALIADFEHEVKLRGGITIYLGSDDEDGMTTLANMDLYDDVSTHLANIYNLNIIRMSFTKSKDTRLSESFRMRTDSVNRTSLWPNGLDSV